MQLRWIWRGIRTGIVTTRYPKAPEAMPARWRGVVAIDRMRCEPESTIPPCVAACMPRALSLGHGQDGRLELAFDQLACIACGRCVAACPADAVRMTADFELSVPGKHD